MVGWANDGNKTGANKSEMEEIESGIVGEREKGKTGKNGKEKGGWCKRKNATEYTRFDGRIKFP